MYPLHEGQIVTWDKNAHGHPFPEMPESPHERRGVVTHIYSGSSPRGITVKFLSGFVTGCVWCCMESCFEEYHNSPMDSVSIDVSPISDSLNNVSHSLDSNIQSLQSSLGSNIQSLKSSLDSGLSALNGTIHMMHHENETKIFSDTSFHLSSHYVVTDNTQTFNNRLAFIELEKRDENIYPIENGEVLKAIAMGTLKRSGNVVYKLINVNGQEVLMLDKGLKTANQSQFSFFEKKNNVIEINKDKIIEEIILISNF